jgi:hypothetical protein
MSLPVGVDVSMPRLRIFGGVRNSGGDPFLDVEVEYIIFHAEISSNFQSPNSAYLSDWRPKVPTCGTNFIFTSNQFDDLSSRANG